MLARRRDFFILAAVFPLEQRQAEYFAERKAAGETFLVEDFSAARHRLWPGANRATPSKPPRVTSLTISQPQILSSHHTSVTAPLLIADR